MSAKVDEARRALLRVAAQAVGGVGLGAVGGQAKAALVGNALQHAARMNAAPSEGSSTAAVGNVIKADPSNYLIKLAQLKPGVS
jgi:hypothetical protein